ncbi:MAG: MarR family winged helix-turn-helix transcriptional regulator [Chloroflexota bacterium]
MGVSRQAVNELVQGLQRQGLVKVEADPLDGRAKLVYPTAAGKRSITVAHEVFEELEGALERRLGAVAFERLRSTLMDDWGDAAAHAPAPATLPPDRSGGPALRSGRG